MQSWEENILIKQEGELEGKQELMRKLSNKFSIKQISEMLEIDISEVENVIKEVKNEYHIDLKQLKDIQNIDCLVLAVAHNEFKTMNLQDMIMDYKRLMKKYLYLLFCSIITMLVFGYVYINHYFSFIVLIGFTCSFGSTIELISLIITTHKGNKEE